jgi:hypothetical protein
MQTANFFIPAERLKLRPSISEQSRQPAARQSTANVRVELAPEHRLWKVCGEAASSKLGKVDVLVFAFFAIVAVIATACSFSELFHTLGSGALEQTVRALITR